MDVEAAWEIVRDATPATWTVGRPLNLPNHRWAVWAIGPRRVGQAQTPRQLEGTEATEAEALVDHTAKLRALAA